MTYLRVLQVEWLKLKRNKMMLLIVCAPVFILALQFINFKLRYQVLMKPGISPWWQLIQEVGSFWGALVLPVLMSIIVGMICAVEHSSNAWKYLLTMPFKRSTLYIAKLVLTFILVVGSSLILVSGLVLVGIILGFKEAIPWEKVFGVFMYPLLGIVAITSIQLWLSTRFHNFSVPLGIGVMSVVSSLFLSQSTVTHWYPWVYPFMTAPIDNSYEPIYYSLVSICVGILCTVAGIWEFSRRNV